MPKYRAELLEAIAELWRGDWSGRVFDGRDGQRWIEIAIWGSRELCAMTLADIKKIAESEY